MTVSSSSDVAQAVACAGLQPITLVELPPYRYAAILVRRARELGFTPDEVRALLKLSETDGTSTCHEVREISAAHLADVRQRIADLWAMERVLSGAIRQCDEGQQAGCPLTEALSQWH